jgi:hypothetical protein
MTQNKGDRETKRVQLQLSELEWRLRDFLLKLNTTEALMTPHEPGNFLK